MMLAPCLTKTACLCLSLFIQLLFLCSFIISCKFSICLIYRYFPLEMLVRHLEVISCRYEIVPWKIVIAPLREGGDPGWVPATLQGVGVSVARLLDVYNRLYTAKDSVWLTSGDELHILKVTLLVKIFSKIMLSGFVRPSFRFCFSPKQSATVWEEAVHCCLPGTLLSVMIKNVHEPVCLMVNKGQGTIRTTAFSWCFRDVY